MNQPRVSVLVITYNHAPFVEEALESLRLQTSRDFEVVIIDDASLDGTGDVIEAWLARTGFQAKFVRNPRNQGVCKNRNLGLSLSTGTYVCTLAGDDAYEPERIASQLACFDQQPEHVAAVYSDAVMVDERGHEHMASFLRWSLGDEPPPQGRIFARLLRHNFLCAPAVMARRNALAAVGGYDEALAYEDYDKWLRLAHRYDFVCLPERVLRYRLVPTSLSHSAAGRKRMRESDERILSKWLDVPLDADERCALMDAYWRVAKMYLYMREDPAAERAFANVARRDPRRTRRAAAKLLTLPGAHLAARALASSYRRLHHMPEPG